MKDIYVHTSDLGIRRYLCEDPDFVPTFEYNPRQYPNVHRNEYGYIRTEEFRIHILLGNIPQRNCPWCGIEPCLKKLNPISGHNFVRFFLECPQCLSLGPVLNICEPALICEDAIKEYEYFVHSRYQHRLPWDDKLEKGEF